MKGAVRRREGIEFFGDNPFDNERTLLSERSWRAQRFETVLTTVRKPGNAGATVQSAYRELLTYRHELAVLGDVRGLGVGHA